MRADVTAAPADRAKLKAAWRENEHIIQTLLTAERSGPTKQKLDAALAKGTDLLTALELPADRAAAATDVNNKSNEPHDVEMLVRVCGLNVSVSELYKPDDKPQLDPVVKLRTQVAELKQHRSIARFSSFAPTIDDSIAKLEKVEVDLNRSQLDGSELAQIPVAVFEQIEGIMNVTVIQLALLANESMTESLLKEAELDEAREWRDLKLAHHGSREAAAGS